MTLYEINAELQELLDNAVDPDTGEILDDFDAKLDELLMQRDTKVENIALAVKNLNADAEALKAEKLAFEKRQKTAVNKAERLKNYLLKSLNGEKFSTAKVAISYRNAPSAVIDDEVFFSHPENAVFFRIKTEADKKAITDAIKAGKTIEGAELVTNTSIQIK